MITPPHSGESGDAFRIDDEILDPDHFIVQALEAKISSLDGKIAELERGAASPENTRLIRARALFEERLGIARSHLLGSHESRQSPDDAVHDHPAIHEQPAAATTIAPMADAKSIPHKPAGQELPAVPVSTIAAEAPTVRAEAAVSGSTVSRPMGRHIAGRPDVRRVFVPPGAIPQPRKYSSVKGQPVSVTAPIQKRSGQIVDRPPGMMSFLKHVQSHTNATKIAEEAKAQASPSENLSPPPAAPESSSRSAVSAQSTAGMSSSMPQRPDRVGPDHRGQVPSHASAATPTASKGNMLSYLEKMRSGGSAQEPSALNPEKLMARPAAVRIDVKEVKPKAQEIAPKQPDTDTKESRENLKSELQGLFDEIK